VLFILIEVSLEIVKVNKSSTASQELKSAAKKRERAINLDFISMVFS
jgi:hypothetical protein